jgi:hypothetical protein
MCLAMMDIEGIFENNICRICRTCIGCSGMFVVRDNRVSYDYDSNLRLPAFVSQLYFVS